MTNRWVVLVALGMLCAPPLTLAVSPSRVSAEDRQQINDLVSKYAYAYDSRDIESFLALFTHDCVWEAYAGSEQKQIVKATNRDELKAVVSQRLAMLQQKGIQSRHYQTNTVLTVRGDGQVEGVTMLNLMWQVPGEKPMTAITGTYRDLFVKTDSGWKFSKRTAYIDQAEAGR